MKKALLTIALAALAGNLSAGEAENLSRSAAAALEGIRIEADKAPRPQLPRPAASQDFFDETGDGAEAIPAALSRAGVKVISAEHDNGITTVVYDPGGSRIRTAETRGEYGPGDGARIDAEARKIVGQLLASGMTVIWTGRWNDMVNGATVYFLDNGRLGPTGCPRRTCPEQLRKSADKADLDWKFVNLRAADGTIITVDYVPVSLGGEVIAAPVWITVVNGAFKGTERVRVVLLTYYDGPAQAAGTLFETRYLDPAYTGHRSFQAKTERLELSQSHIGYGFSFRQEIAVAVDGVWLTDPVNGTHNFRVKLGWN